MAGGFGEIELTWCGNLCTSLLDNVGDTEATKYKANLMS